MTQSETAPALTFLLRLVFHRLHHSTTPPPHYSATPLLRHPTTPPPHDPTPHHLTTSLPPPAFPNHRLDLFDCGPA